MLRVFSHKNFLSGVSPEEMVKIKNKKKLEWCLKRYATGQSDQRDLAKMLDITTRRFRQLYTSYKSTALIPVIGQFLGRPKIQLNPNYKPLIIEKYGKYQLNALYLESVIFAENNIRIPHNTIHTVLKQEGFAKAEPNKQKRRKAYIRYERKHSLSAVHLDWHEPSGGPKVCAVEDDSSRLILSGGEFENATEENSILLMREAIEKTREFWNIRESITDHGTQFYANKRDKEENAKHGFEEFLKEHNIKQILCRYKHPQSNGKIERWWGIYDKHRKRFSSFDDFVEWYNNRPHGSLNLRRAETPKQAFLHRLPDEYFYGLVSRFLRWQT